MGLGADQRDTIEKSGYSWVPRLRCFTPIGNIPPAEAEANYYAALDDRPVAAQHSSKNASGKPGAVHKGAYGRGYA